MLIAECNKRARVSIDTHCSFEYVCNGIDLYLSLNSTGLQGRRSISDLLLNVIEL